MVSLRKRVIDGKTYYYLEQSVRQGATVKTRERYLGSNLPEDVEAAKRAFLEELFAERWHGILDEIRNGFSKRQSFLPTSAREKELETFMVKFTYDSQRIEGSKLTLRETADLLERGVSPTAKPIRDVKEAEAHKTAFYEMLRHTKGLSLGEVLHWHRTLFTGTKPDIAGKIRTHGVAISGSRFVPPPPVELELLLREFFAWYAESKGATHPVELAALVHLKFVTIHPFTDGNGRISRLMMNFALKAHGYPLFDIPYENRAGYYTALERAQTKKDERIFTNWFIKRYVKESKSYARKT